MRWALLSSIILLVVLVCHGQQPTTGNIRGKVVDQLGALVSGAVIPGWTMAVKALLT